LCVVVKDQTHRPPMMHHHPWRVTRRSTDLWGPRDDVAATRSRPGVVVGCVHLRLVAHVAPGDALAIPVTLVTADGAPLTEPKTRLPRLAHLSAVGAIAAKRHVLPVPSLRGANSGGKGVMSRMAMVSERASDHERGWTEFDTLKCQLKWTCRFTCAPQASLLAKPVGWGKK
jgi:hypothetical protein